VSTAYSLAALRADISTGALAATLAPLVAARNDVAIAAAYNLVDGSRTCIVQIPTVWLLEWGIKTGVRAAIETAANTPSSPVYGIALGVRDLWWGVGASSYFDLTDPDIAGDGGLLADLAAAGVLNVSGAGSVADLLTWGTVACSYAEKTFAPPRLIDQFETISRGTVVPVSDVSAALNGG
jgi:hypothetical protein